MRRKFTTVVTLLIVSGLGTFAAAAIIGPFTGSNAGHVNVSGSVAGSPQGSRVAPVTGFQANQSLANAGFATGPLSTGGAALPPITGAITNLNGSTAFAGTIPGAGQTATTAASPLSASSPYAGYGGGYSSTSYSGNPGTPESLQTAADAQVISAAGQYNQETAAAANNLAHADSQAIKNSYDAAKAVYQVQDLQRAELAKRVGPRPTPSEIAYLAHVQAPRPLNTNQIDPVSGELHWPGILQEPRFANQRVVIGDCTLDWVRYGELTHYDQVRMREAIGAVYGELREQISNVPPQEYVACRSFLGSLLYATTRTML